jgi:3D (Asp-Asp-Asp) domain-containing protein
MARATRQATRLPLTRSRLSGLAALALLAVTELACTIARPREIPPPAPPPGWRDIVVTATAYNSTPAQTDSTPTLTAHGVQLEPGMRIIAVSRDLEAMGLRPGTRVEIEGLPGSWTVADRMPRHRRRAIDVYMGLDVERALAFGRREVRLRWLAASE